MSSHRCTDNSYFCLRRGNWSRESYSYPSVMVVQALWQQTPLALKTEGLILTATATSTAALYFIRQGIKTQREKNVHKFAFFSFYTSLNSPHSSLCLCLLTKNVPLEISYAVTPSIPYAGLKCFKTFSGMKH